MTKHNSSHPAADPSLASNYAETTERWIAAVNRTSQLKAEYDQATSAPVSLPGHTFTLHIAADDGRLTAVDITDAVRRAHFQAAQSGLGPDAATDVHDALPGDRQARLVHRIMLVTCHNPSGSGEMPIDIDPEAARWLPVVAHREQRQAAETTASHPAHGTDDCYPYGGDYDAGREYTLTCYCGREFTGDTDGAVETDYAEHISDVANE